MLPAALSELEGLGDAPRVAATILGLMPETGVMVVDADLRLVLMEGPVYARHGYDVTSGVGRSLQDVIPAVAWSRLGEHWLAALAGERRTLDTVSIDGERDYWLHFGPLSTGGGPHVAIMVAQDITERVRGREQTLERDRAAAFAADAASRTALHQSEERFRQGFENAPIAMTLVDPASMRYMRVNDAFCRMIGRTREALQELTYVDISHPADLPAITGGLPQLVRGSLEQLVVEKRYLRPDGSEVWASVSITPVLEAGGDIDVLFGQMVDITERKTREASLHAQLDEIAGLGEIRRAFEEDRFELHAQPIIDLATGETVQRELLIRMRGADGELIAPGAFLPAAEKHGAIRDIDRWVLARGADLAAGGVDVEINISAASIGDPGLVADIERELARTGADPARLVFEITETALIAETEVAVTLAERLRRIGCRFALDDFGSGYGGFHYLKHLPMDFLKVDREFIRDARTSVADQHVIRAIVGLARGFGLQTIAEGVEDQETLDLLRELGVDHAQGFHIGQPALLDQG